MKINVNGEPREVPEKLRLAELVTATPGLACAVNGEVVPASEWQARRLADLDDVEVLSAFEGG